MQGLLSETERTLPAMVSLQEAAPALFRIICLLRHDIQPVTKRLKLLNPHPVAIAPLTPA